MLLTEKRPRFWPRACPVCGSPDVARILYGEPTPEAEASGLYEPGGCCIGDDDPRWACRACEHRWGHDRHGRSRTSTRR